MTVRSKHNDLLNYFVHDKRDLSRAYVKHCEKFLKEISDKLQAPSGKLQATSLTGPELWDSMGLCLHDFNPAISLEPLRQRRNLMST